MENKIPQLLRQEHAAYNRAQVILRSHKGFKMAKTPTQFKGLLNLSLKLVRRSGLRVGREGYLRLLYRGTRDWSTWNWCTRHLALTLGRLVRKFTSSSLSYYGTPAAENAARMTALQSYSATAYEFRRVLNTLGPMWTSAITLPMELFHESNFRKYSGRRDYKPPHFSQMFLGDADASDFLESDCGHSLDEFFIGRNKSGVGSDRSQSVGNYDDHFYGGYGSESIGDDDPYDYY